MNDFLLLFFLLSSSFLPFLSSDIRQWTHTTSIHFNENPFPVIPVYDHSHSINYFLTNFFMSKLNTTLPPLILPSHPFTKMFLIIRSATRSKQVGISVRGASAVLDNLIFTIGREERFVCLCVYVHRMSAPTTTDD